MELFDKKFVHFLWDDELQGKKCFVSDGIDMLKEYVEHDESNMRLEVTKGHGNRPFAVDWTDDSLSDEYQFAYYDPNYEVKKAYTEGKTIQFRCYDEDDDWYWVDCDAPYWNGNLEYRVKPEEKTVIVKKCSGCVHEHCSATKEPCVSCKPGNSKYEARLCKPEDSKPEEKLCKTCKHFDTEVGSEPCDSCIGKWNYPNWESKKEEKKWRPYINSAEMIMDFIDRFKVNCPSYCEPLIWVKGKETGSKFLIFAFYETFIKFNDDEPLMFKELFNEYTYLDGSPCGMEVKE